MLIYKRELRFQTAQNQHKTGLVVRKGQTPTRLSFLQEAQSRFVPDDSSGGKNVTTELDIKTAFEKNVPAKIQNEVAEHHGSENHIRI